MNKNKVIALLIILAVYFGPFGALFLYSDVLIDSFRELFLFLLWIGGMIAAFYISVNEPFSSKKTSAKKAQQHSEVSRKAA